MIEVYPHLFVGCLNACRGAPKDFAIVHACKFPCHRDAVGKVQPGDEHYLSFAHGRHLYLNIIDPPTPLFRKEIFETALEFMERKLSAGMNVLVHCNVGESRSPSIALLYMARQGVEDLAEDYRTAASVFKEKYYPAYRPNTGIQQYLEENWEELIK